MVKKRTSVSKNLQKAFKDVDIFGKPVNLNFNEEGNVFKTYYGSFISLVVIVLVSYLVINKAFGMVQLQNPQLSSFEQNIKQSDLGFIDLKKEKFLFYFTLVDPNYFNLQKFNFTLWQEHISISLFVRPVDVSKIYNPGI